MKSESIQDQINILFKEKVENLESFLEQRLNEFKSNNSNLLSTNLNDLEQIISSLQTGTDVLKNSLQEVQSLYQKYENSFIEDFEKPKYHLDLCLDKISSKHEIANLKSNLNFVISNLLGV